MSVVQVKSTQHNRVSVCCQYLLTAVIVSASILSPLAYAEEAAGETDDVETQYSESQYSVSQLEEVVITAPRTLGSLKSNMISANNNLFEIFNTMNEGTPYEVICRRERPVKDGFSPGLVYGSENVCLTSYHRDAVAQAIEDAENGIGDGTLTAYIPELEKHDAIYDQKLKDRIASDPAFRQAIIDYARSKQKYDAAIERDDGFFASLFKPLKTAE